MLYKPLTEYSFIDPKRKMGVAKTIKKQITKFDIKLDEIGLDNLLSSNYNF